MSLQINCKGRSICIMKQKDQKVMAGLTSTHSIYPHSSPNPAQHPSSSDTAPVLPAHIFSPVQSAWTGWLRAKAGPGEGCKDAVWKAAWRPGRMTGSSVHPHWYITSLIAARKTHYHLQRPHIRGCRACFCMSAQRIWETAGADVCDGSSRCAHLCTNRNKYPEGDKLHLEDATRTSVVVSCSFSRRS